MKLKFSDFFFQEDWAGEVKIQCVLFEKKKSFFYVPKNLRIVIRIKEEKEISAHLKNKEKKNKTIENFPKERYGLVISFKNY